MAILLPPEIISRILLLLQLPAEKPWFREQDIPFGRIAPYAAISRQWQDQVEQRLFATLYLTQHRLARAARVLSGRNSRRQGYVTRVCFNVELEDTNIGSGRSSDGTRDEQADRNSEVFSVACRDFYKFLSDWRPNADGHYAKNRDGISLLVDVYSPSDPSRGQGGQERHRQSQWKNMMAGGAVSMSYESEYLDLLQRPMLGRSTTLKQRRRRKRLQAWQRLSLAYRSSSRSRSCHLLTPWARRIRAKSAQGRHVCLLRACRI